MAKMTFGYWDFRGFGEACRYILEYCNCDYEDLQYERRSARDHDNWRSIKDNFGLDFPNLPYLIDGNRKLTESVAIMKYIGRKYDLIPKTEDDKIRGDILEGVILDYRTAFYDTFFVAKDELKRVKEEFQNQRTHSLFEKIVKFMGDRKWLVTDEITYLDFLLYACLAQTNALFPSCVKKFKRIETYMQQFQMLPGVSQYLKCERFKEFPEHDPYIRQEFRVD